MKRYLFFILILCITLISCFFNDVENAGSESPTTQKNNYLLSFNFDETSGLTTFDSSGNGGKGKLSSIMRTAGKVNNAVSFPLSSSIIEIYFDIPHANYIENHLGSLSIYSWIRFGELVSTKKYSIFTNIDYSSFSIEIIDNLFTVLYDNVVYLQSSTALEKDKWIHFVFTSDGNKLILYLNGQEDCSKNIMFPVHFTVFEYTIGGRYVTSVPYYIDSCFGTIDEFNILKIALTAAEVHELYSKY